MDLAGEAFLKQCVCELGLQEVLMTLFHRKQLNYKEVDRLASGQDTPVLS